MRSLIILVDLTTRVAAGSTQLGKLTVRPLTRHDSYLALLNDVGVMQHWFNAESPGRFEVLDAILSPHPVVILALLSRHDRATLLTREVGCWGESKQNVSRTCGRRDSHVTRSGRRACGRETGGAQRPEAQRQRTRAAGRGHAWVGAGSR